MEAEIIFHYWDFLVLQNCSGVALAACREIGHCVAEIPYCTSQSLDFLLCTI